MKNCIKINISNKETDKTSIDLVSRMKLLRFSNVNARSLENKTAEIVDHVLSNNINVCIVTETWLKDADTDSMAALSPPGYLF